VDLSGKKMASECLRVKGGGVGKEKNQVKKMMHPREDKKHRQTKGKGVGETPE